MWGLRFGAVNGGGWVALRVHRGGCGPCMWGHVPWALGLSLALEFVVCGPNGAHFFPTCGWWFSWLVFDQDEMRAEGSTSSCTKPPPFFVWAPLCLSKPWTPPPLYLLSAPAFYFIFLIKYKFCFLSLTLTLLCKGTPFPSNNFAFSKRNTMNIPEKFLFTKILFVIRL